MKIETAIKSVDIERVELKNSSAYAPYYFVSANVNIEMRVDGEKFDTWLQTGHGFDHNDYNCPTNQLSVYDQNGSILEALDQACESDIDEEFASEINDQHECTYSASDLLEMYHALLDLISDAAIHIQAAADEAEEEARDDGSYYIAVTPREQEQIGEDEYREVVCGERELLTFSSKDDADEYIEDWECNPNNCDLVRMIDAEEARGDFPDEFN